MSRTIRVTLSPKLMSYVGRLLETGLFGSTHAEVVELLVSRGILGAIRDGLIDREVVVVRRVATRKSRRRR